MVVVVIVAGAAREAVEPFQAEVILAEDIVVVTEVVAEGSTHTSFFHGSVVEGLRSQGGYIYGSRLSRLTLSTGRLESVR